MADEVEGEDIMVERANDDHEQDVTSHHVPFAQHNNVTVIASSIIDSGDAAILSLVIHHADRQRQPINVAALIQHKFVDLEEDGRIKNLSLGGSEQDAWQPWDLHPSVARLDNLVNLSLVGCRSVPWNALANIKSLENLNFHHLNSSSLLSTVPENLQLSNIKSINFERCTAGDDPEATAQLMSCITSRFPSLRKIRFVSAREDDVPLILRGLASTLPDAPIKSSLEHLVMTDCHIQESHLETILFDVLPQYTRLDDVFLGSNDITSLQSVADRLRNENLDSLPPSVAASRLMLCELQLHNNPVIRELQTSTENLAAFMTLLDAFPRLENLGVFTFFGLPPEIKYKLRINIAGRVLLGEGPAKFVRPIPLSVWPYVLSRSVFSHLEVVSLDAQMQVREVHEQSGLYYLLRNGGALAGRNSFDAAITTTSADSYGSTPSENIPRIKRPRHFTVYTPSCVF